MKKFPNIKEFAYPIIFPSILMVLGLTVGCMDSSSRTNQKLMDYIESNIQLPDDALSANDYARYFAIGADNDIFVVYMIPSIESMEELCALNASEQGCGAAKREIWSLNGGERLWLQDERDLPVMDGGGCGYIRFKYDTNTKEFTTPHCNGLN